MRWWIHDSVAEKIIKGDITLGVEDLSSPLVIGFQKFKHNNAKTSDGNFHSLNPLAFLNNLSSQIIVPVLVVKRYQICWHIICFLYLYGPWRPKSHTTK